MSAALVILPVVWATSEPLPEQEAVVSAMDSKPVAPEMAFYRKYTEGMLRRYVKLSMEAGRAPSLLGREMFRGRVTNYQVHSFDDVVIFVHDVEKCLAKLDENKQYVLRRIALQEYTQEETAKMMGLPTRTVIRRYERALDRLTQIFLAVKLLEPMKECQGGAS
jgi:predicted DNA-binding protein (UPF0251 family)